jgi:hypothetical protein
MPDIKTPAVEPETQPAASESITPVATQSDTTGSDTTGSEGAPFDTSGVVAIEEAVLARLGKRNGEIRAAFGPFLGHAGVRDLMDQLIDDPKATVEQARGKLLAKLGEGAQPLAADANPKPPLAPSGEDPSQPLETRAKATWDRDPAIRAEFGQFSTYLAFRKVEIHQETQ